MIARVLKPDDPPAPQPVPRQPTPNQEGLDAPEKAGENAAVNEPDTKTCEGEEDRKTR